VTVGRYRLDERLGGGGGGQVWKAWDPELARPVAIKFVRGTAPDDLARFEREARAVARLAHPHIAALYEAGEEAGRPYLVLEYVPGATLRARIGHDRARTVRLVRDAARAVAAANAAGIVHRDLKPDNLVVDPTGREPRICVLDFGLARPVEAGSTLSAAGDLIGTPAYMAPEQARGDAVDARTDVYGLGATLYEVLTGRPPFRTRDLAALLARIQRYDPAPPRSIDRTIDRSLDAIVLKCLEKDPVRRYPGAAELAADLTRWLDGAPVAARAPSPGRRLLRAAGRHRWALAASAVAALVAGLTAPLLVDRTLLTRHSATLETAAAHARGLDRARELVERARPHLERAEAALNSTDAPLSEITDALGRARPLLEEARDAAPTSAAALHLLGRAHELAGDLASAERSWRRAIAIDPGFAPARLRLGRLLVARAFSDGGWSRREEERAAGRDRCSAVAREAAALLEDAPFSDDQAGVLARAVLAAAQGDYDRSLHLARHAIARWEGCAGLEEFHWLAGSTDRTIEEQLRHLDRAIELRPRFAEALAFRGSLRLRAGDTAGAAADFSAVRPLRPRDANNLTMLGKAIMTREPDAAIAALGAAIEIDPSIVTAWTVRALARLSLSDEAGAVRDCDEALRLDPDNADAHVVRGDIARVRRDYDGALEALTRAIELDPRHAGAWQHRGTVHLELRRNDEAERDYDRSLQVNPRNPFSLVGRGEARARRGDRAGALADFEAARAALHRDAHRLRAAVEQLIEMIRRGD